MPIAFTVVPGVTENGPVYSVEEVVGVLPSVVYQTEVFAPASASVTVVAAETAPAAGLIVGATEV